MYLVHINPVMRKSCHDHSNCATPTDRDACSSPKQMLLFADGSYAFIHAAQSKDRDHVRYQLQPATSETRHLYDRCSRRVVKSEWFESFGVEASAGGSETAPNGPKVEAQDLGEGFEEISLQAERAEEINLWEKGERISSTDADWQMI